MAVKNKKSELELILEAVEFIDVKCAGDVECDHIYDEIVKLLSVIKENATILNQKLNEALDYNAEINYN